LAPVNAEAGDVSLLLGEGNGNFQEARSLPTLFRDPRSLTAADLNGDGSLDIATVNRAGGENPGRISILLSSGGGSFEAATTIEAGIIPRQILADDLDGDRNQDLLVLNSDGSFWVLRGTGNGTSFDPPVSYAAGSAVGLSLADLDGDSILDLAAISFGTNVVQIIKGIEGGMFGAAERIHTRTGPDAIIAADLDGDGNLDLATAHPSGSILVLPGHPRGVSDRLIDVFHGVEFQGIVAEDLDNDGIMDLAAAGRTGEARVFFGRGDFTFQVSSSLTVRGAKDITAADLDGNGVLDLITANEANSSVSILLGSGGRTYQDAFHVATGLRSRSVIALDLDQDGVLDLVTGSDNSLAVSILTGNGDGTFQEPSFVSKFYSVSSLFLRYLSPNGEKGFMTMQRAQW